jgi:hypothetical protein
MSTFRTFCVSVIWAIVLFSTVAQAESIKNCSSYRVHY